MRTRTCELACSSPSSPTLLKPQAFCASAASPRSSFPCPARSSSSAHWWLQATERRRCEKRGPARRDACVYKRSWPGGHRSSGCSGGGKAPHSCSLSPVARCARPDWAWPGTPQFNQNGAQRFWAAMRTRPLVLWHAVECCAAAAAFRREKPQRSSAAARTHVRLSCTNTEPAGASISVGSNALRQRPRLKDDGNR